MLQANGLAALANLLTVYWFGHLWNASGIVLSMLLGQIAIALYCMFYWARYHASILARHPAPNAVQPIAY
jgi:hypothetical protein